MMADSSRPAPYVSLRHARTGRVGGEGRLPAGWEGEHAAELRVVDIGSAAGQSSIVVRFTFAGDMPGDYAGLCLGPHLSAQGESVVALSARANLDEIDNVAAAFIIVREWREGGEFVRQSMCALDPRGAPRTARIDHQVGGDGRVVRPVLLTKRASPRPGSATVTLTGLAFGEV
ncbi:MAG: hypothetical protein ACR2FH_02920 [Caulobacteraceae bacterium]